VLMFENEVSTIHRHKAEDTPGSNGASASLTSSDTRDTLEKIFNYSSTRSLRREENVS
jgi:hypothetical protein